MDKKLIFTIIVLTSFLGYSVYVDWIIWWLYWIFSLLFYLGIVYFLAYLWILFRNFLRKKSDFFNRKLNEKKLAHIKEFAKRFYYSVASILLILTLFLWSFVYYHNYHKPFGMPTYYMTNWEKQITFQGMIHIGQQSFYDTVKENLIAHKEDWYVLYYEWVKPAKNPENGEKFNKAIWFDFDADLYSNMSKLYGLEVQKNSDFLWLVNDLDYNVDVSMDDIIENYEKIPDRHLSESKEVVDINSSIIEAFAEMNDKQLYMFREIMYAIMWFFYKNESVWWFVKDNLANEALFKVILDKRNEYIADYIISNDHDKVFIMYWELHFDWVFELLKENDSNWRIEKTDYLYPLKK